MASKVRFGLKNVHYALLTEGTTNSWSTPVAVPGAVSIDLSSESSATPFYADNVTYYQTFADNGYTGTLEMAMIPDQMLQDVWNYDLDSTTKVLYEGNDTQPNPFALLFEVETDDNAAPQLFALYRVVPSTKPTQGSSTIEDSVTPGTQSFDFSALPLVTGTTVQQGLISGRTTDATTTATRSAWFSAVTIKTS